MDLLKMLSINEKGAIQPCHTPEKKPAGLRGLCEPPPGKQEVSINIKVTVIKAVRIVFLESMIFRLFL